jgi:hypothetical protein
MAAARLYPTVKYAMGHGKACTRMVVGGTPVVVKHDLGVGLAQPPLAAGKLT